MAGRTTFEKIWQDHLVAEDLLFCDLHLVQEVSSPQAFDGLRLAGRRVRRPDRTIATADHAVPTIGRALPIADDLARRQVEALERSCAEFGVPYRPYRSAGQGIVHVIGPELGLTQPGMTIVCGDSHTSTHGAFGALAFGIGTSEVEHVLATQTLVQRPLRPLLVRFDGLPGEGVTAKDMALATMAALGTAGGTGHVIEYRGAAVERLSMEARMTLCNMSIEAGARAGLVAPDETTFAYLDGRPCAPADMDAAVARWRELRSDPDAAFAGEVAIDAAALAPMVTWGTTPAQVAPVTGTVPEPADESDARALAYMGLEPGMALAGVPVDRVFIGSCTNGRIEDLEAAAAVIRGRRVADGVRALVVPGSMAVRAEAERRGLAQVFAEAGFEWREAGCSMCVGMNDDVLAPGERCASTSNRNFEGRQGYRGRTHLMSPAMAAAAAVRGAIADVRTLA